MTDRGEPDIISEIVASATCDVRGCGARGRWWFGENPDILCDAHHALALVKDAHAAMLALSPEDRARFDDLVEAWARENGQE